MGNLVGSATIYSQACRDVSGHSDRCILAVVTPAAMEGQDSRMTLAKIQIWDPLIRTIHWLLAAAVLLNWVTDSPLWLHTWIGY